MTETCFFFQFQMRENCFFFSSRWRRPASFSVPDDGDLLLFQFQMTENCFFLSSRWRRPASFSVPDDGELLLFPLVANKPPGVLREQIQESQEGSSSINPKFNSRIWSIEVVEPRGHLARQLLCWNMWGCGGRVGGRGGGGRKMKTTGT